ncbi:hypothetical protein JX265_004699 [Neoarthrinium moseri]|uniref:Uncharacterized protein n=1 Tax=Neoarthrinium moseri TaxID=1658444 RepID=A0A9P9WQ14_9PEZI|nr:uncharacterized protein JN550_003799 [Neoarthrinium moseri]KAI1841571.1 hypothetical protein JX266_012224 [Neoarthrinium moseri]KAI1872925.1 hypothetical protein JN550_003799 [Neoarthrinium moseri]KAI1874491.1 hypothetical protein JX265_004699 [Neoarthrinium moseri]
MPSRKLENSPSDDGQKVIALCHLIMSCENFQANMSALCGPLGIAQAKNVPRKINSIITPFGFEFKSGKVTKKDDDGAPPSTPVKAEEGAMASPASTTGKKKRANGVAKTPVSKKRKADNEDEEVGIKEEGDEADEVDDAGDI